MRNIFIGNRQVGIGHPTYIIAEMSANHLHNLDYALEIVDISAHAGVDAVKIQTLTPDTMTIDCDSPDFIINEDTAWDGRKLYDLYSETPLPYSWHQPIFERCKKLDLDFFSTPYDVSALHFLDNFNLNAYKISSFEIMDIPLIKEVAKRGKPIIISTGVATLCEIQDAVEACLNANNKDIILLKCTSAYPSPYDEINLKAIPNLAETFNVVSGLSDHTLGIEVAIASVAIGACVIEKHVTLSRALGGPDSHFSLEPQELCDLVTSIRNVEKALGSVTYEASEKMNKAKCRFGRSLYFISDLKKGETITNKNVRSIRPGFGLEPKYYDKILGKKVNQDIRRGTRVAWNLIHSDNL